MTALSACGSRLRQAIGRGLKRRTAVAEAAGVSVDVAGRWIYEARKRDLIRETSRERERLMPSASILTRSTKDVATRVPTLAEAAKRWQASRVDISAATATYQRSAFKPARRLHGCHIDQITAAALRPAAGASSTCRGKSSAPRSILFPETIVFLSPASSGLRGDRFQPPGRACTAAYLQARKARIAGLSDPHVRTKNF
jgi:hypothetical protein